MQCWRKLLVLPIALLSTAVMAEDPADTAAEVAEPVATESDIEIDTFEDASALSDEQLNSHRARENIEVSQITINDQEQDGEVTDNVAIGNTNGDNLINGEAFSDSSGFLSTVQNTGNNVLIQNSTIINVTVETPTD